MSTIALDTETYYEKPTATKEGYSVSKMGNWRYCHDDRFDCYMVSVFDGEQAWAGHPRDFNWDSLTGATLLSHNKGFDAAVTDRLAELQLAPKLENPWLCTANFTSFLCNRRALATASQHLLNVKVSKAERDWMNGKRWEDAVQAGKADALLNYAKGDVIHCRNIWNKYGHLWTPIERELSDLTIDQCARGVAIDVEKLRRYKITIKMVLFHIEQSLPWVLEGAKVTSPKAIAEQCRRVGIPSPPIKSHEGGEEAFIAWEELYGPRFAWVSNVSRYRSINKILTTLETIEERLRPDDTIDFSLLYFGAHTGRWSGGGSGLNMQNLLKSPIYVFDDYSLAQDDADMRGRLQRENVDIDAALKLDRKLSLAKLFETVFAGSLREKIDMRSLFIPRPGHDFVICDLAQIEPRVLNWCAGNFELLERLRTGMSIYEAHARDTMGWTGGELKKEDPTKYKAAKARVLGLGYGCGKDKFKVVAKTLADYDITVEEAAAMVDEFRAANPKITALWETLDNNFRQSIGHDFEVGLPSGRTMRYEGVLRQPRPYKNKATGKMEFRLVYTADVGGTRKMLYGGLLTENLVQATSRDVFAEHLISLKKAGIHTVFSVHDEAVTEVPKGTDPREVEKIMSQTPPWIEGCPIGAEATVASYYMK
jgi:hypothetical protein